MILNFDGHWGVEAFAQSLLLNAKIYLVFKEQVDFYDCQGIFNKVFLAINSFYLCMRIYSDF